ncbi:unnamed protein product [Cylicostephanus goldi]|uniref:Serpin domain-containing protein n=1 Tax=Cylicostephanus goldi TaxID=71465 RepID=A0A3P7Q7E3_CYLGO|nr:unnamed protein product [Cylicostephanus goldi]
MGANDKDIKDFYSSLSNDIRNSTNGVITNIANAFFLQNIFIHVTFTQFSKKYTIAKQFADTIHQLYAAKVEVLDFDQIQETAKTINAFVDKTTKGKIKDFIHDDMVKVLWAVMTNALDAFSLVVNAIYFTAKWEYVFFKEMTSNATFYSSENQQREIEFLKESEEYRYYTEDERVQVLSLRYKDTSYAFNVFLPRKRFALEEVKRHLDGEMVQKLLSKLKRTYVTVTAFPQII